MMNEEQYLKYIEKMVLESLDVQFNQMVANKSVLDRDNKNTIATLFANPSFLTSVVHNLRDWSYTQAEKNNFERTPNMASFFLSPIVVRNYTMQYVNYLTQMSKQVQENQQTR